MAKKDNTFFINSYKKRKPLGKHLAWIRRQNLGENI